MLAVDAFAGAIRGFGMHIHRVLLVVLAAGVQSGCANDENTAQREAPPAVEDTVFGDTVQTIDKARAVESTVLQHKDELDRAVGESEGE